MKTAFLTTALIAGLVNGDSCPSVLQSIATPTLASGYVARLLANNLTSPRGIEFDKRGALLVVEEGKGITALNLADAGGNCLTVARKKLVINAPDLNHGLQISGNIIYASSGDTLYSWAYSPMSQTNTSAPTPLVTGMAGSDHTTRTLMLSKRVPGMIVINRGSNANLDPDATNKKSGHAQVKAFNITGLTKPRDFNTQGKLLGWGLRNDVGIAEHPTSGKIYTVENSADQITRFGQDIHQNNPAEEMNMLGYLDGTYSPNQGRNFGYPDCFTAWQPSELPNFNGQTGDAFAIGDNPNDTICADRQVPRLSFQAHMAPLDILFNDAGTKAVITFHGSWDRSSPVGYQVAVVDFANGQPVQPRNSTTAAVPLMWNADMTQCPGQCFRPVSVAWDSKGRLFMSSDATGEIWVISKTDGSSVQN